MSSLLRATNHTALMINDSIKYFLYLLIINIFMELRFNLYLLSQFNKCGYMIWTRWVLGIETVNPYFKVPSRWTNNAILGCRQIWNNDIRPYVWLEGRLNVRIGWVVASRDPHFSCVVWGVYHHLERCRNVTRGFSW